MMFFKNRVPVVIQMQSSENAAATLSMMLGFFQKYLPISEVRKVCVTSRNGTTLQYFCEAAASFGLNCNLHYMSADDLKTALQSKKLRPPVVIGWRRKYYAILRRIKNDKVYLTDAFSGEQILTYDKFSSLYRGFCMELTPGDTFVRGGKPEPLLKLVSRRLTGYGKQIRRATVLNGLAIVTTVIMLSLNMHMLDDVVSGNHPGYFIPLIIGMSLCLFLNLFLAAAKTLSIYDIGHHMASASGAQVFKKLLRLPLNFYEHISAGELLERLENNSNLDYLILQTLIPRTINIIQTLLYICVVFHYNHNLALICFIVECLYILISNYLQQKNAVLSRSVISASGSLNASALNGLSIVETIKATASENQFFQMWRTSQQRYLESRQQIIFLNTLMYVVRLAKTTATSGLMLFIGVYFISRNHFSIGMLSSFQSAWNVISSELVDCMTMMDTFQNMRTSIERIDDLMARNSREPIRLGEDCTLSKLRGHISVQHLSYRYNTGDKQVLNDISMEVKPGQIIAIVGKTGCGKSTLLRIIGDLYKPESGQVLYDGMTREQIPDAIFYTSLTSVDQEITMFKDSLKNNITLWDNTIEDFEMILALKDAHIYSRILQDPDIYYSLVEENGKNFSGGELQRLELSRALCREPSVLLLDEFTSALDEKLERAIFKSIRDRRITCIIVAHRLSTVANCDHIIVMDHGSIVEQGSPQQLYDARGKYYELVSV